MKLLLALIFGCVGIVVWLVSAIARADAEDDANERARKAGM